MKSIFLSLLAAASLTTLASTQAFGHDEHGAHGEDKGGHHFVPKPRAPLTTPAAHYSGSTPIDRTNGNFFNVGTIGVSNPGYEQWAKGSTWAVSLADAPYSYEQKEKFIETLDERIRHFELAIWNYERVTDISKPEGKAHAAKSITELKPRIEKARDSYSKAKSSNRGEWETAQNEAKKTFLELQQSYYDMHKNTVQ